MSTRITSVSLEQARASARRRTALEKIAFVVIEREGQYRVQPKTWPYPFPEGWVLIETVEPEEARAADGEGSP